MSRRAKRRRRENHYNNGEDVNPMNYVSNLSDVMLILAVGIMLALVIRWNVDINTETEDTENTQQETEADSIQFDESDLTDENAVPDSAQRMGNVYYDPDTGSYYIIKDSDQ